MPLLVNSVPNLAQGVSQQPDNLRYPGQCDEQINAWATVVEGLVKRPNTRHINKLFNRPINDDSYVQYIDRDANNRFACVLENKVSVCAVSLFNLNTGNPVTQVSISTEAQTYLNNISNPREDVKALTVADYTLIANKEQTVSISSSNLSLPLEKEALIVVNLGDYDKNYSVYINDSVIPNTSSVTTSGGTVSSDYPATYRSGSGSSSSHGGFDADTEHIAKDLNTLIAHRLSTNTGIVESITVTNGGSGYVAGEGQTIKVFVEVDQYDSSGVLRGTGAQGWANIINGSIQSVDLFYSGSGYDSSYQTPVVNIIPLIYDSENNFIGFGFLYVQTPATATATLGTQSSFKSVVKDAVIKITGVSYVTNNNQYYRCIQSHTAAASNEPGVGTSYEDYWELLIHSTDLASAWSSGTDYSEGSDFNIRTSDGLADQGLTAIYKEVQSITDLPAKCYNSFRVKVIGDTELVQDDYYVKFKTKEGNDFGEGSWVETIGWEDETNEIGVSRGITTKLNKSTLPLQLKPTDTSFNYWTLSTIDWTSRKAGDDKSNPAPSFVGSKIKDIFFFKNRLGFITKHDIIFSESDEYFNFWRTSVLSLLDSAPIDVGISHTKVTELQHAIAFQEKLLLFSNKTQFVLRGNELLSPKTVSITPATEYDSSETVTPLVLNNYLYFSFKRNSSNDGLMEYYVDNDNNIFDASEITAQVPTYIPSTTELMAGCAVENLLVTVSSDRTTLFVYKFFWQNKEKIQSAWQKFTFSRSIVSFNFIESDLYIITKDSSETFLEKLPMENKLQDQSGYNLLLDSRIDGSILTKSYDAATKITTISNFPFDPTGVEIYTKKGHKVDFTRTSATAGTVSGDLTSTDFFAGVPYNMLYRFSNQVLKQPTERGGRSASDYTFQTIRNGSLNYAESGHFTVEVTPKFRDTYSYAFNPDILGSNLTLNTFTPQDGHFRFPVQAQPGDATIEVKSDSALPVKILAAEFESTVIPRSKRYGS
jgi:hypothetical protein